MLSIGDSLFPEKLLQAYGSLLYASLSAAYNYFWTSQDFTVWLYWHTLHRFPLYRKPPSFHGSDLKNMPILILRYSSVRNIPFYHIWSSRRYAYPSYIFPWTLTPALSWQNWISPTVRSQTSWARTPLAYKSIGAFYFSAQFPYTSGIS